MQTEAKEGDAQYTEDASQSQSRQWPVLQQKDRVSYPDRLKESLGSSREDHGFSMKGFLLKVHGSCYILFFLSLSVEPPTGSSLAQILSVS